MIDRMGTSVRAKGTPSMEFGLDNPDLPDAVLVDAMRAEPIPVIRPIVVAPKGVRLGRPSQIVAELLP